MSLYTDPRKRASLPAMIRLICIVPACANVQKTRRNNDIVPMSLRLGFVATRSHHGLKILELLVVNTTPSLRTSHSSYRDFPLRPHHVVSHVHSTLELRHLLELVMVNWADFDSILFVILCTLNSFFYLMPTSERKACARAASTNSFHFWGFPSGVSTAKRNPKSEPTCYLGWRICHYCPHVWPRARYVVDFVVACVAILNLQTWNPLAIPFTLTSLNCIIE